MDLKALAAVAALLGLTFWTTMLKPPPVRDEMDEEFDTYGDPPFRGWLYGNFAGTVFMWLLVVAAAVLLIVS